jgi:hypothetical protein
MDELGAGRLREGLEPIAECGLQSKVMVTAPVFLWQTGAARLSGRPAISPLQATKDESMSTRTRTAARSLCTYSCRMRGAP